MVFLEDFCFSYTTGLLQVFVFNFVFNSACASVCSSAAMCLFANKITRKDVDLERQGLSRGGWNHNPNILYAKINLLSIKQQQQKFKVEKTMKIQMQQHLMSFIISEYIALSSFFSTSLESTKRFSSLFFIKHEQTFKINYFSLSWKNFQYQLNLARVLSIHTQCLPAACSSTLIHFQIKSPSCLTGAHNYNCNCSLGTDT